MHVSPKRAAGALALSLAALATTAAGASADPPASPVVGHAYVDDNPAGPNTVAAFDRHADGSLTPTPGSPFSTGGTGLGRGLGSQGAIQRSADGRFLLAVNAGSNDISVLRVGADGVPHPVGPPVASRGITPVSIAVSDDLVYVANTGEGGANYAGFRLSREGMLSPLRDQPFAVPDGTGQGDVLFDPSGERLIGTRDNPSLIDSFKVHGDGGIKPAQGSPFPGQGLGQIGAQFSPVQTDQLFVTNAHNGPGLGTVSAFRVGRNGLLESIGASPFADFQTAPCWVEISRDGRYLFAVNTGSATISSYAVAPDGTLTLLGTTPFRNGAGAVDARLSPDGTTLSVTGGRGRVVSVFAVDGGTLTEVPSSPTPLPAGTSPTGIVVS